MRWSLGYMRCIKTMYKNPLHHSIARRDSVTRSERDECAILCVDTERRCNPEKDTNLYEPRYPPQIAMPIPTSWSQISLP